MWQSNHNFPYIWEQNARKGHFSVLYWILNMRIEVPCKVTLYTRDLEFLHAVMGGWSVERFLPTADRSKSLSNLWETLTTASDLPLPLGPPPSTYPKSHQLFERISNN
jgi:hypothetical protein